MWGLKGITVELYERVTTGVDGFGAPIYAEVPTTVENVLVSPVSADEMTDSAPAQLNGKIARSELSIPKGDTHNWEGNRVKFFGHFWRVIGTERRWMDEAVPLAWNAKYTAERIDNE